MLYDGAARYKRRFAARKIEHDVAQREKGCQSIPQPLVGARSVNGEASHHARVVVRGEVEVARIGVVVAKLPVIRLGLGEVRAKDITNSLAGNARKLASVKALEKDIEAHGL